MNFKHRLWLLVLVLICFMSSTFAQGPSSDTSSNEETVKIDTILVNVPIVVRDQKGKYLSNLKAEDFVLYENGVKQNIELFATENAPANILIMMESSADCPGVLPYGKEVAKALIEKIRPSDNVGIVSFDTMLITNTLGFTKNQTILKNVLETAKAGSNGIKLRNAIYVTATQILKKVSGRKVLVVISTGNDTGSEQPEREILEQFVESDTTVYTLFYPPRFQGQRLSSQINPPPTPTGSCSTIRNYDVVDETPLNSLTDIDEMSRNDDFLQNLTEKSGGRFFDAASSDIKTTVDDIISELSLAYSLAYSPSNAIQNQEKRKIQVELKNKQAVLRYKRAYEAKAKK